MSAAASVSSFSSLVLFGMDAVNAHTLAPSSLLRSTTTHPDQQYRHPFACIVIVVAINNNTSLSAVLSPICLHRRRY
jgi:hypothetical protein